MTNDPVFQRLVEISWRRKLTEAEKRELQEWLAAHGEVKGQWEAEAGLNAVLESLPNAPVPSNFTARVLAEAQRQAALEAKDAEQGGIWRFWKRRTIWLPRAAFAAVLLGSGLLLAYHQHEQTIERQKSERQKLGQDLAEIAGVGSLPSQVLTNFDAIRLMTAASTTPTADVQLLNLMQ